MYVPSVSSASTPVSLDNENQIKILEAQLNKAQSQLLKENKSNEEDYDGHKEKIEALRAQIQQIQMQIQKIKDEQNDKEIQTQLNQHQNKDEASEFLKSNYNKKIDTLA